MHFHKRNGFTLVELLVVIVIISMLAGLLIPAIISARATARRTECMNNMKNLGDALIQFDLAKDRFPGYANRMPEQTNAVSWAVMILPNIQRTDIWDILRSGNTLVSDIEIEIDLFACPSDHEQAPNQQSYVVNCGQEDQGEPQTGIPQDWPSNGVFLDRYTAQNHHLEYRTRDYHVTASRIVDGAQHTLLLSENIQAGPWNRSVDLSVSNSLPRNMEDEVGMVWWPDLTNLNTGVRINEDREVDIIDIDHARPSSNHSGGVNVVFCDGHSQFLREDIDYDVYARLMTPDGQNAMDAGTRNADNIIDAAGNFWQGEPLDADDYIE